MQNSDRIHNALKRLRQENRTAFIPYICAGDPSLAATRKLVDTLTECGSDIIELGVPFSDPMADGPTIQKAAERALAAGTTLKKILAMVAGIRKTNQVPLVLMTYFNPVHRYGVEKFCRDAGRAGVDGLIIPDLPPEEAHVYLPAAQQHGLSMIFLAAPTSTDQRLRLIARATTGFIYCVAVVGVTGERRQLSPEIMPIIKKLRTITNKPLAIGFGISTPEHVRQAGKLADAVIVGSAIVKVIERAVRIRRDPVKAVQGFVGPLIRAAHVTTNYEHRTSN
jgi:tryptophan synthase alpha chain